MSELEEGIYHIQIININTDIMGTDTIEFKILDSEKPNRVYEIKTDQYWEST